MFTGRCRAFCGVCAYMCGLWITSVPNARSAVAAPFLRTSEPRVELEAPARGHQRVKHTGKNVFLGCSTKCRLLYSGLYVSARISQIIEPSLIASRNLHSPDGSIAGGNTICQASVFIAAKVGDPGLRRRIGLTPGSLLDGDPSDGAEAERTTSQSQEGFVALLVQMKHSVGSSTVEHGSISRAVLTTSDPWRCSFGRAHD